MSYNGSYGKAFSARIPYLFFIFEFFGLMSLSRLLGLLKKGYLYLKMLIGVVSII